MRVFLPLSRARRVAVALFVASACGGGSSEPRPAATLASSTQAAVAFDAIRTAWGEGADVETARRIRSMLETFLVRFPRDGLVPLARVTLALTSLRLLDFAGADAELALTARIPPGTAHDLRTLARAVYLRLRGNPDGALALLRPLVGKSVDPLGRALFEEELTRATLATHREYEAISYMDAWLRATSEEEKPAISLRVAAMVEHLPRDVLVGSLQAMRAQRASFGYGIDIERILSERLVRIATTSDDAALARILLDSDAGAIAFRGDGGAALGELATSRRGLNLVFGRTVGLLLPTGSPGLRDESADVLRGVMWALGLPRGVRDTPFAPDGGVGDAVDLRERTAGEACAPAERATLDEPSASEGVRLVTRDDAGSADRTEVALDELAGEGAAVIVAGLDEQTSAIAIRWGERHQVPVIVLVRPSGRDDATAFGFLVGEKREDVIGALLQAAPALATETVAPVVDTSELVSFQQQGKTLAGLNLAPAVSCDTPAVRAGEPRFPLAAWGREKARAWLVTASPGCSVDLVDELDTAHAGGIVALTLEAAALVGPKKGLRVVVAHAGVVPTIDAGDDPRRDEVSRFQATFGRVGWWTALGRDAATLARIAVQRLPFDEASDPRVVVERRIAARDRLVDAKAPLWSTEKTGWNGTHRLPRTVCATLVGNPRAVRLGKP